MKQHAGLKLFVMDLSYNTSYRMLRVNSFRYSWSKAILSHLLDYQ